MSTPRPEDLAGVPREELCGLLDEIAGAAWRATYDHAWQRDGATWRAVVEALGRAAGGARPAGPRPTAPSFLRRLAREQVEHLSTAWSWTGAFAEVRLLERLGLVELEHDDAYVLAVVGGLGEGRRGEDRAALLRADPELLALVPRFFEVEGGGEVSLANRDKYSGGPSWKDDLAALVADGTLPRDDTLRRCVEALGRDFSAYRAAWFTAFLDVLAPTPAELAVHQARLRRLLGSSVTATASAAARALTTLAGAGLLDDDACDGLAPALVGRTKGTALAGLRLLGGVAARRPDLTDVVAATSAAALEHPNADVQRAAVKLLDGLGAGHLTAAAADGLAPTVRRALDGPDGAAAAQAPPLPVEAVPVGVVLPAGAALVEAVAAVLEEVDDPDVVESALAGLAATDEPALLAPLARRAATLLRRNGFRGEHPVRAGFAGLVVRATGGGRPPFDDQLPPLLTARLAHVAGSLAGDRAPGPLLATPTNGAFVDPGALVARLGTTAAPHPADLVTALLRLGPDGRAEASGAFSPGGLPDGVVHAVRMALGGVPADGAVPSVAVRTAEPWFAAAPRRPGIEVDPSLDGAAPLDGSLLLERSLLLDVARLVARGPDDDAWLDVRLQPFSYTDQRGTHHRQHAEFAVRVGGSQDGSQAPDGVIGSHRTDVSSRWTAWAASVHPLDTEPAFRRLALHLVDTLDDWEVDHVVPRALTALARHPGRVGRLGAVTAAAGLAAQDATHRVLGVDAVEALARRRTLTPAALAAAMRTIAPAARLPRWASSLTQLAQGTGSDWVVDVLTGLVPHLERDARGLVTLLDVLAEESTRARRPVTDAALDGYLRGLTGGSGAAAAARRTLAVTR